jgi:hypothetical protein
LKTEAARYFETAVPFYRLHYVRSQKTIILSKEMERKCNKDASSYTYISGIVYDSDRE